MAIFGSSSKSAGASKAKAVPPQQGIWTLPPHILRRKQAPPPQPKAPASRAPNAPVKASGFKASIKAVRDFHIGPIHLMEVLWLLLLSWIIEVLIDVDMWESFIILFVIVNVWRMWKGSDSRLIKKMRDSGNGVLDEISSLFSSIANAIGSLIKLIVSFLVGAINVFWASIKGLVDVVWKGIMSIIQAVKSAVGL